MRIGLALPHYDFSIPGVSPIRFEALAEVAVRAERLGFDSVWMSDHLFASLRRYGGGDERYGSLEPLSTLAALAPLTERVRLGTLVLSAGFRHPAIVAKSVTAIDRLSDGRVELGIGAGWFADEYRRSATGSDRSGSGSRYSRRPWATSMRCSGTSRRRSRGSGSRSVRRTTTPARAGSAAAVARRGQGWSAGAAARRAVRRRVEHGLAVDARGVRGAGRRARSVRARGPRPRDAPVVARPVHGRRRGRGRPRPSIRVDARTAAGGRRRRGAARGAATRRAGRHPADVLERLERFAALGVSELVGSRSRLVRAAGSVDARPPGRPRAPGGQGALMDPLEAAIAVLQEEGQPLHWTRIQDLRCAAGTSTRSRSRRPQDAARGARRRRTIGRAREAGRRRVHGGPDHR